MLITQQAELLWVRAVQRRYLPDLLKLAHGTQSPISATVRSFFTNHSVFYDPNSQVLRCRTRQENSLLQHSAIYPILIPTTVRNAQGENEACSFTRLLVIKAHQEMGHAGVPSTLSHIRNEFWLPKGRNFVRRILKECFQCKKVQGPPFSTPTAPPLPAFRVVQTRPFDNVGLDYLGPFRCKENKGPKYKVWYILYTCGSTRAVHLEAVRTRNADDFLLALTRFTSECGIPSQLISDHEKSMVKISRELDNISKSKRVRRFLQERRISWVFYTEKSPNKGGFIERLNAPVKKTFLKVTGGNPIPFEQFRTMASVASATMNDRPLSYVYSDIDSQLQALTPNRLIFGYNKNELPFLDTRQDRVPPEPRLSQLHFQLDELRNQFWRAWHRFYLDELNERHIRDQKANKELIVPKLGEVCLIKDGLQPRRSWRLCRIVEIRESRGTVRECTVQLLSPGKTQLTKVKRPPQQLIPLELPCSVPVQEEVRGVNETEASLLSGDLRNSPEVLRTEASDPSYVASKQQRPHSSDLLSKQEKALWRKRKIHPPYKLSKQFTDTSSINTGPEPTIYSKPSALRDFRRTTPAEGGYAISLARTPIVPVLKKPASPPSPTPKQVSFEQGSFELTDCDQGPSIGLASMVLTD